MYTEEPRREINWGNLIKKGLIILLVAVVIFLLIWIVTKNNSNSVNVNSENNNNTVETNKDPNPNTYSEIFINNYRYFHDTAKEYFLISNLPKKNETLKFTLQELIDKKLVLPFGYTDKESCDTEASYVAVKNTDGKYEMTTTLVCGIEVASTKEELGCNQICVNNIDCDCNCTNTEKVTEYEYKQAYTATENVYTCDSGYTKTGSGSNTKCVKKDSDTKNAIKETTKYCMNGEKPTSEGCPVNKATYVPAIKESKTYCENGATPTSEGCPVTSTTYVRPEVYISTYCENGATPTSQGCPVNNTTTSYQPVKYKCTSGDLVNTAYCRIYSTSFTYQSYTSYKGKTYNGCTYSGSYTSSCGSNCTQTNYKYYCSKQSYKDVAATKYCTNGATPTGQGCPVTSSYTTYVGTRSKTVQYCTNGATPTSKGCPVTNTTYVPAIKESKTYCENGATPTSKGCPVTKDSYTKPITKTTYTCDKYDGYTKVGFGSTAVCTKGTTTTVNPTITKKQVTKYLYKWSKEETLAGWERTGKTRQTEVSSK